MTAKNELPVWTADYSRRITDDDIQLTFGNQPPKRPRRELLLAAREYIEQLRREAADADFIATMLRPRE